MLRHSDIDIQELFAQADPSYNDLNPDRPSDSMIQRLWQRALVQPKDTLLTAIRIIDSAMTQMALVVDDSGRLVATVTDGDIRRALLKGVSLNDEISQAMNLNFQMLPVGTPRGEIRRFMLKHRVRRLPLLDAKGCIVELAFVEALVEGGTKDNWVVIMAGGLGTRLRPLTDHTPKPLVKVGARPILETILIRLSEQGFHRICLAVNYKADLIEKHFKDGSDLGLEIRYLRETKRMGSAGALSLIPDKQTSPVLVMNADLLTNVAYSHLLDFHIDQRAMATMCVKEYQFQVPYGVVSAQNGRLESIEEKPTKKFFVNAGIYVLEPETLAELRENEAADMPTLLEKVKDVRGGVALFPIREYWLDIGKREDFARANREVGQLDLED